MKQKAPLRARLRWARYRADHEEVVRLSDRVLARRTDDVGVLRGAARTLTELGQDERAAAYWQGILAVEGADLESLQQLVRRRFRQTGDLESALTSLAGGASRPIREIIRATLAKPLVAPTRADDLADERRIVSICGVSFSGSTLLDRVLGSLPGVRSIGESHWLGKSYVGKVAAPIDFSSEDHAGVPSCSVCGRHCEVLSMAFRAQLCADRREWYFKIARRLDTRLLIAADKNAPKLVDNDPLLRMDCLVVFKSPLQAWLSHSAKLPAGGASSYRAALEKYSSVWQRAYREFLDEFRPAGRVAFVHFDDLARRPGLVLPAIAARFALPFDESVLERAVPGHAIGGHAKTVRGMRTSGYTIRITPLPKPGLPASQVAAIENDRGMQEIYERLLGRYRAFQQSAGIG